ncbi:MAG: phosphoribosyltransferase family protein [Verrucomicrobiota bacterium]
MEQQPLSWSELGNLISQLTEQVRALHCREPIDRLVGISRGGLPIGVCLSHRLGLPFTPVEVRSYREDRTQGDVVLDTPEEVLNRCTGHVLLVDDLADSGRTFAFLLEKFKELTGPKITIATLYYKPTSVIVPHHYVEETSKWIVFPWEE